MPTYPFSSSDNVAKSTSRPTKPTYNFSSFMMFFNDTFIQDAFFINFGMTNSIYLSNIIGSGAQFDVKLYRLDSRDAFRTSHEASSRITKGATVILKRPKISSLLSNLVKKSTKSAEKDAIDGIVQEWRVISHPGIREHKNILDVYGFAWEDGEATKNSSIAVWPVIIVEYAELGTLDQFLASSGVLNWETKLRLASGISHEHCNAGPLPSLTASETLSASHSDGIDMGYRTMDLQNGSGNEK